MREVTAEERRDLNLPLIERGVLDSPIGFELSFEELSAFASRVGQVIDGLFVWLRPSETEPATKR